MVTIAQESWPSEFYIFVNTARWATRHNFEYTGKFVSAAFSAAVPDAVPPGALMQCLHPDPAGRLLPRWAIATGESDAQSALRQQYINGDIDYLPFSPNLQYFGRLNPFGAGQTDHYRVEVDAELVRRRYYRTAPSRLSAVYAFDEEGREQVIAKHGEKSWPRQEIRTFRLQPHPLARVCRVNMEIVSIMRRAYQRGTMFERDQLDALWAAYWTGHGEVSLELPVDGRRFEQVRSGCIWEYLIEGVLELV